MEKSEEQKQIEDKALKTMLESIDKFAPMIPELINDTLEDCTIPKKDLNLLLPKMSDDWFAELDKQESDIKTMMSDKQITQQDIDDLKKLLTYLSGMDVPMEFYTLLEKATSIMAILLATSKSFHQAKNAIIQLAIQNRKDSK